LKPLRVSRLNAYIRRILSSDPVLMNVSVIGEITNFRRHGSGHVYFSLRDENSKMNCFLPSDVYGSLPMSIGDGREVTATGRIDVYERGGTYSLYIRELALEGAGGLAAAFEEQKRRLMEEGLFDPDAKKSLPAFPLTVALVTSATGAAVEDMLKIIQAKNDVVDILIYPTLVQGPDAAAQIAGGVGYVNERYPQTDVMIVGRGGGSAEELWAFNEEVVARAIFASEIPVISAVGHETDVTIADFVADARAETPSAAAEMAVPDIAEIQADMNGAYHTVREGFSALLTHMRLRMDACAMPRLGAMLGDRIGMWDARAGGAFASMRARAEAVVREGQGAAGSAYARLRASDPARIMSLGYAALMKDGRPLRSAEALNVGDAVTARFADGVANLTVDGVMIDKNAV
jgi:exodeoxyribonuclease VII large subunit